MERIHLPGIETQFLGHPAPTMFRLPLRYPRLPVHVSIDTQNIQILRKNGYLILPLYLRKYFHNDYPLFNSNICTYTILNCQTTNIMP